MDYNKCTTLVGDVDGGDDCAHVGVYGNFSYFTQFCYKLKTALKNQVYWNNSNSLFRASGGGDAFLGAMLRDEAEHSSSLMDLLFAIQCRPSYQEGQSG